VGALDADRDEHRPAWDHDGVAASTARRPGRGTSYPASEDDVVPGVVMRVSVSTVVQVAGSLLILVPFVLVQVKRLRPESRSYIWLNLVGSTVLALDAWHGEQWGFLLLEATWAVVSLLSLLRPPASVPH
jgi:uncharacterized membrane protein YhaH (DUF805 family)